MRSPRLTRLSEGKPFRRLLVTSKALGIEISGNASHGTPLAENPNQNRARMLPLRKSRFNFDCTLTAEMQRATVDEFHDNAPTAVRTISLDG